MRLLLSTTPLGRSQGRPTARLPVLAAAAWLVSTHFTGCGGGQPTPTPATERIAVQTDRRALQARHAEDPEAAKLPFAAVVKESCDGIRGRFGDEEVFPLTRSGDVEITAAFAVRASERQTASDRISHELRLRAQGRDETLASGEIGLAHATRYWSKLIAHVHVEAGAELVVVTRWLGNEPPPETLQPVYGKPVVVSLQPELRNVLVLTIDTLRADHLGTYGYPRATSPHLDAFVAQGTVLDRAISTSPWTLPAYGTLFTGLEPARHHVGLSARRERAFGEEREEEPGDYQSLDPDVPTLAGLFASAGWFTGAYCSNQFLDSGSGIDRGFDEFAQYMGDASVATKLAQDWIQLHGQAPWFLVVHWMDPHMPYVPPAPYDTQFAQQSWRDRPEGQLSKVDLGANPPDANLRRQLVDSYDGEIAYTDAQIGVLLQFLRERGDLARTIVVLHGDHGEEFWEHGGFEHGHTLHEEVLHVPLAFVAPGLVAPGARIATRTSTVDVFATLLELAGIPVPEGTDSTSFASALRTGTAGSAAGRACISEATLYGPHEQKSWSLGLEKFITDGAENSELFDLGADPGELVNTATQHATRIDDLKARLLRRSRALFERHGANPSATFSAERRAELERLGYPGGDPK